MRSIFKKIFNVQNKTKGEWLRQAFTLVSLGKHEEALAAYEQAIVLDPDAYLNQGETLTALGQHEEALVNAISIEQV